MASEGWMMASGRACICMEATSGARVGLAFKGMQG